MTNQEHFNRSVAVLVKAHLKGTLIAVNCAACACGNLVAAANGYEIINGEWVLPSGDLGPTADWYDVNRFEEHPVECNRPTEEGLRQVASTSYSPSDFARIEEAFMWVPDEVYRLLSEDINYHRLMNVVDLLAEIHHIDLDTVASSKLLFVEA